MTELIRTNSRVNINAVHFTHIMKCGGSTLDSMLYRSQIAHNFALVYTESTNTLPGNIFGKRLSMYDAISPTTNIKTKRGKKKTKNSIPNKENAANCDSRIQHNKLVLVIVRDPIDRVISHYQQVRPYGTHTGSDRRCSAAASKGFRRFLDGCRYSNNFMSSYHNHRIMEVLPQYSLVIPFEHYNTGIVLLHMYCGFKVEDILYIAKKNYTQMPKVQVSADDMKLAIELNKKDFQLYYAAQELWNRTVVSLTVDNSQLLQQNVEGFKKLLNEFYTAYKHHKHTNMVITIPPNSTEGVTKQLNCTRNVMHQRCILQTEIEFTKKFCETNRKCYNNNLIL